MKRKSRSMLVIIVALLSSGPLIADEWSAAHFNPYVRDYFRQVYQERISGFPMGTYDDYTIRERPSYSPWEAQWVDQMIDLFVARVREQLRDLDAAFADARSASEQMQRENGALHQTERTVRLRENLQAMRKRANKLRMNLAYVFSSLDYKSNFKPRPDPKELSRGFSRELDFIGLELDKARREIVSVLLVPSHTIDISQVRDGNMMIHLHRVEKMAGELERVTR